MGATPAARAEAVQATLERLAAQVEDAPAATLEELCPLLVEISRWPAPLAFVWGSHIAAQACRFLGQLERAIDISSDALSLAANAPATVRAHLRLEQGIALREQGDKDAVQPLQLAARAFRGLRDHGGEATCLCELALAPGSAAISNVPAVSYSEPP